MATVVQTNYRPQIRPATPGMLADMTGAECTSYISETQGLGFGLAVSVGTLSPNGCVLGGGSFLGITVRDVTLPPGISVDPMYSGSPAIVVDTIPQYTNLSVMTRGHIWVLAGAKVNTGDPLWYNQTSGQLTNATGGVAAKGSITFTANPVANNTIVVDGTTITFVASGATGAQVNIGPTLGDTLVALATMINGSADVNLTLLSAEAYPPSPGGAGQGSGANQLLLSSKALGTAGNAYTLAAGTTPGTTLSGATFAGGVGGTSTQVPSGYWASPSLVAGDLAVCSLAIQR